MSKLDVSLICLGSRASNDKTRDVEDSVANELIKLDRGNFVSAISGLPVVSLVPDFDYGLVLKIHPKQFPERTWFTCSGIDEWGTSGASWYLARKWRELHSYAGESPFAIVVKVKKGQDESAEPILRVRNRDEVSYYASISYGTTR